MSDCNTILLETYNEAENPTPKLDTLYTQREQFLTNKLPVIKTERKMKAENWRRRKNRSKGASLSKVNYYSTKDLKVLNQYNKMV